MKDFNVISLYNKPISEIENGQTESTTLSALELSILDHAAYGIRLAAEIVDKPCSDMNVDHFLQVFPAVFFFYPFVKGIVIVFRKWRRLVSR